MSFFKMLIYMWKKIVRKQINLLLVGLVGKTKIRWLEWNEVRLTKNNGGLESTDVLF